MMYLRNILFLPIFGIILAAVCSLASCESSEPEPPRLYNEQDSIALCAIMAEAPACSSKSGQWREGDVHNLTPDYHVAWGRVDGETTLRIFGVEMETSDWHNYEEDGTLSNAIGELKYLKNLRLAGIRWTDEMPSSLGDLENIETLEITNTKFTKLPPKLNIRKAYDVKITWNRLIYSLSSGIEEFALDIPGYIDHPELLDLSFNNLTGAVPVVEKSYIQVNLEFNEFTSADISALLRRGYNSFNANMNQLSGEIPKDLLKNPEIVQKIIRMVGVQQPGYGYSNLPINYPEYETPTAD